MGCENFMINIIQMRIIIPAKRQRPDIAAQITECGHPLMSSSTINAMLSFQGNLYSYMTSKVFC